MHWGQWTFLDFVFAGIVLISIAFAVTKGLVREITSLVALICGFTLAVLYYQVPARLLAEFCRTEVIASFIGFLIIFLGCLLLGAVVAFFINRFMKAASLQWVDRLLGGVFGLLRGWAVASILVVGLIAFPIRDNLLVHSVLAPYLLAGARAAVVLVPQGLKDRFNEQYRKVLESWNRSRSAQ